VLSGNAGQLTRDDVCSTEFLFSFAEIMENFML
jgi:hypothetical protein